MLNLIQNKKFIFLFFVLLLILSLFVIMTSEKKTIQITVENNETIVKVISENNTSKNTPINPLLSGVTNIYLGDLDGMIKNRSIRVLVVPSEIMFLVNKGKRSGFSYEYMKLFEKQINKHFTSKNKHIKTRIVFIPTSHSQIIPKLLKGEGDLALANMSITSSRKEKIDFSDPYAKNMHVIAVTGPNSPNISDMTDLAGKEISVRKSSSYYGYLVDLNTLFKKQNKEAIRIKIIPQHVEGKDVLTMLNAGLIGMTIMDQYEAKFWSRILPNIKLHSNILIKDDDQFALLMRKNSPKLMKEANIFIKANKMGTLMGNILAKRYTENYKFEKETIDKTKLKEFDKVVGFFRKYAKQYNLEAHLILSQAYQESKLNQAAKSHAGALGVMQLLPSTGKSMEVGDINQLEPNIHAGVKYQRWLIDRYFTHDEMDILNQTFFAFAAYNAGPRRVIELRKEAKKRGYNPNIWFDNVEIVAAEIIGSETVTYVSNIYAYYVAYTLYEENLRYKSTLR